MGMRAGGPTFHGINDVKNVAVNSCCAHLRLKKSLSKYPMQQELSLVVGRDRRVVSVAVVWGSSGI